MIIGHYKVKSVRDLYPENILKEGIVRSLRGCAADSVRYLIPQATILDILAKLDHLCSTVASFDILMQPFFKMQEQWGEMVSGFVTRLEGS